VYVLQQVSSGRFLDAKVEHTMEPGSAGYEVYTNTQLPDDVGNSQEWTIRCAPDRSCTVVQMLTQRFLDGFVDPNPDWKYDKTLVTRTAQADATQAWKFRKIDGAAAGTFMIERVSDGLAVEAWGDAGHEYMAQCKPAVEASPQQHWVLTRQREAPKLDSHYYLQSVFSSRVLDVRRQHPGGMSPGFEAFTRAQKDQDPPKFQFKNVGGDVYMIEDCESHKVLDAFETSSALFYMNYTAVLRMPQVHASNKWVVLPVPGSGPNVTQYVIMQQSSGRYLYDDVDPNHKYITQTVPWDGTEHMAWTLVPVKEHPTISPVHTSTTTTTTTTTTTEAPPPAPAPAPPPPPPVPIVTTTTTTTTLMDLSCKPNRTACDPGMNCGKVDNGCGEEFVCGAMEGKCPGDRDICDANMCKCEPQKMCADGMHCGTMADGCGGQLKCGECEAPFGTCEVNKCICKPTRVDTCDAGLDCGFQDDGCGGEIFCGECDGTCTENKCTPKPTTPAPTTFMPTLAPVAPAPAPAPAPGPAPGPACLPKPCNSTMQCGTQPDGCGGVVQCGAAEGKCPGPADQCRSNMCVCVPFNGVCNKECGQIDDGCGKKLTCIPWNSTVAGQFQTMNANNVSYNYSMARGPADFDQLARAWSRANGIFDHNNQQCNKLHGGEAWKCVKNQCKCKPKICEVGTDKGGKSCGKFFDGCGNNLDCGMCTMANQRCDFAKNVCIHVPQPPAPMITPAFPPPEEKTALVLTPELDEIAHWATAQTFITQCANNASLHYFNEPWTLLLNATRAGVAASAPKAIEMNVAMHEMLVAAGMDQFHAAVQAGTAELTKTAVKAAEEAVKALGAPVTELAKNYTIKAMGLLAQNISVAAESLSPHVQLMVYNATAPAAQGMLNATIMWSALKGSGAAHTKACANAKTLFDETMQLAAAMGKNYVYARQIPQEIIERFDKTIVKEAQRIVPPVAAWVAWKASAGLTAHEYAVLLADHARRYVRKLAADIATDAVREVVEARVRNPAYHTMDNTGAGAPRYVLRKTLQNGLNVVTQAAREDAMAAGTNQSGIWQAGFAALGKEQNISAPRLTPTLGPPATLPPPYVKALSIDYGQDQISRRRRVRFETTIAPHVVMVNKIEAGAGTPLPTTSFAPEHAVVYSGTVSPYMQAAVFPAHQQPLTGGPSHWASTTPFPSQPSSFLLADASSDPLDLSGQNPFMQWMSRFTSTWAP